VIGECATSLTAVVVSPVPVPARVIAIGPVAAAVLCAVLTPAACADGDRGVIAVVESPAMEDGMLDDEDGCGELDAVYGDREGDVPVMVVLPVN